MAHVTIRQLTEASDVDLFLDESGCFPSLDDPEPSDSSSFPSQVAGFLAPGGCFDETAAHSLLEKIFVAVDEDLPEIVHGTELIQGVGAWSHIEPRTELNLRYNDLIVALVRELKRSGLQPVRLVNRERIRYAERIESQVSITAELVTRIADRLAGERHSELLIRIHPARTTIPMGEGRMKIRRTLYADAVEIQTSLALARRGLPANFWRAEVAKIEPATVSRRLQIADLISHASHDNFSPCKKGDAKKLLQGLLSQFDFTLAMPVVLDFVDHCLAVRSLGSGIQALAERIVSGQSSRQFRHGASQATDRLVDALMQLPMSARDNHLHQLLAWVEQIIQQRRDLDLGISVIKWIMNSVEAPLRTRLVDGQVEWFAFGLRAWLLTALNHKGGLVEGQSVASEMESLAKQLAGRWDYSPILLGGLITIAVHETDRRDFADAVVRAEAVADYYGTLAGLFSGAMPKTFPPVVKSNLRGKALGTAVQAYVLDGDRDLSSWAKARALSEEALAEFQGPDDIARQQQYRSHLESRAGDFAMARKMLALSLKLDNAHHEAIADAIVSLSLEAQGFPLLHWLRIGAEALFAAEKAEAKEFLDALNGSGLRRNAWCEGEVSSFPAHGILRYLATADAGNRDLSQSLYAVNRLAALKNTRQALALGLILSAAISTVAALLWPADPLRSRSLLFGRRAGGLSELVEGLQSKTTKLPRIHSVLRDWLQLLNKIEGGHLGDEAACAQLLAIARRIIT